MGVPELLIVLGVVVLLFGAKKLPELARSLGRSSSEFKRGLEEGGSEGQTGMPSSPKAETPDTSGSGGE
jgi:sec-independent protein translocase protein TatA